MSKTILVIDDNENNRLLLKDLLSYLKYTVVDAENGREGIRLAKELKPDLILLDLHMMEIDGFETIKIIRKEPETSKIPAIALTSCAMKGDREKAIEAGFDEYLTKPISTRNLPDIIKRILG